MNELFVRILNTPERSRAPLLLVRGVAGFVFLLEGILKFVTPEKLGVGRFIKIGIPSPEVLAPFVGVVEIACGLLIVFGLLTRLAALPLIIDMLVAIGTTKVPILLHNGFWTWRTKLGLTSRCWRLPASCSQWAPGLTPSMPGF